MAQRLAFAVAVLSLGLVSADSRDERIQEVVTPGDLKWVDGPASLDKGAKMAVLEGDPSRPGPFVMRVKLPNGFKVMPHTHPKDERVTVLSGTLHLGSGAAYDASRVRAMPAGS